MAARRTREEIADQLHSAAIRLLRRLRRVDGGMGLSPPAASALSVIVFGGPMTLGDLAAAEQIRPASLTPIVRGLERDGLVAREVDAEDRRVVRLRPTKKGEWLLQQGRGRRVSTLAGWLRGVSAAELTTLGHCAGIIERIMRESKAL